MGPEALTTLEREQRESIFKLRFQHSMGQLESSAKGRTAKRDLARTLTIAAEKRRAAQPQGENAVPPKATQPKAATQNAPKRRGTKRKGMKLKAAKPEAAKPAGK